MTKWERRAWAVLVIASSCVSCVHRPNAMPMAWRPDTRWITGFRMDSSVTRVALEHFQAALPAEAALCMDGFVRDTVDAEGKRVGIIVVTGVRAVKEDSADAYHVYWAATASASCGDHIGISHDHPTTQRWQFCDHSWPDVSTLFSDSRAVFSFVFCREGNAQVLMQDGRRIQLSYARSEP